MAGARYSAPGAERRGTRRLYGFACVGGLGFVVDATILTLLVTGVGWGVHWSRAVSFTAAVTCTWYANRRWVFTRTRRPRDEYARWFTVQVVGAALNLGVYSLLIELLPVLAATPVLPLAAGAALAFLFNYLAATRFVFTRPDV